MTNGTVVQIAPYTSRDFQEIQALNQQEGWQSLAADDKRTRTAWENSSVAYMARGESGELAGYVRGHTDTAVSLYICELLVKPDCRGHGIGTLLLQHAHDRYPATRLELLATQQSKEYYQAKGYRPFYGFRKTYTE